jgi:hypothetical protein
MAVTAFVLIVLKTVLALFYILSGLIVFLLPAVDVHDAGHSLLAVSF